MASAPAALADAGGFNDWNACSNWLLDIVPEPLVSIWSNKFDILWLGDMGALAPDMALDELVEFILCIDMSICLLVGFCDC